MTCCRRFVGAPILSDRFHLGAEYLGCNIPYSKAALAGEKYPRENESARESIPLSAKRPRLSDNPVTRTEYLPAELMNLKPRLQSSGRAGGLCLWITRRSHSNSIVSKLMRCFLCRRGGAAAPHRIRRQTTCWTLRGPSTRRPVSNALRLARCIMETGPPSLDDQALLHGLLCKFWARSRPPG